MGILATATVDIVPNLKPLMQGLSQARVELDRFARTGNRGASGMGIMMMGTGLSASIALAVKKSSDLAEIMNKVRVTFGTGGSSGVIGQANELADKFGLIKKSTLDAAANFGLFAQAAGLSKEQSADFAKQLVTLGADLASFHDISRESAFEKLESGLAGQVRPLREIGIFLSEDAVKARALAMGLGQVGRELTDQEKIRARFSLIMEQAGPAHGDLVRTAESTHNQMMKFQGDIENAITAMGQDFEPALLSAIKLAQELGEALQKAFAGPGNKGLIKESASDLTKAVNELRDMNAVIKSNWTLWQKISGISQILFPGTSGGRATPGTIADLFKEKKVTPALTPEEIRKKQIAGMAEDIEAARRRVMLPTLKELAEAEVGPEKTATEKKVEARDWTIRAHMRRIQAEQDAAIAESIRQDKEGGMEIGPTRQAAAQRDLANRIIEKVNGPGILNTLRNLRAGPINALMGGGVGGMALATGLQAAQAGLEKAGPAAFRERPREPSRFLGDPADFAREAITGVLSEDPVKKETLEVQKQAAKDLEQIKDDVREGLRNIGRGFRGLFPRG